MTLQLYTRVVVNRDVPEEGLRQGDVGMYIEYLKHPSGGEDGAILEIFTLTGNSRVVTVPISAIEAPTADLVLTARPIDKKWFNESVG